MRIDCVQCGGGVEVTASQEFVQCPFCESSLYIDLSGTFPNQVIRPVVARDDAGGLVDRSLRSQEIAGIQVQAVSLRYVPYWEVEAFGEAHWFAARSPENSELARIRAVSGQREVLKPEEADALGVEAPEIPLDAALAEMRRRNRLAGQPDRASMVYLPVYQVDYRFGKTTHRAFVDAVSGRVYEDDPPSSPALHLDRQFGVYMAVALAIFFLEGLVCGPWFGLAAVAGTGAAFYFMLRHVVRG